MAGAETKRELRQVTVATVRSQADAQRIRAVLDGEKIDSVIVSERAVATSRSEKRQLTAICVQVSRAQVARAVEVLRRTQRARTGQSRSSESGGRARLPNRENGLRDVDDGARGRSYCFDSRTSVAAVY